MSALQLRATRLQKWGDVAEVPVSEQSTRQASLRQRVPTIGWEWYMAAIPLHFACE